MNGKIAGVAIAAVAATALVADTVSFNNRANASSQFAGTTVNVAAQELPPAEGIVPIAISFFPPAQFPPASWDVYGVRLNVFVGRHRDVGFVDAGVLGNIVDGNMTGVEIGGFYNRVGSSDGAIQAACIMNYVEHDFCGVQLGLVNCVNGDMQGLQAGAINLTQDGAGIQMGVFNRAERFSGLQVGVANYAYQLQGVQIGAFNVVADSNIPFLPLLNAAF